MPRGPKKSKNKQLQAKNWILTFPQCDTPKESALSKIQDKWKNQELTFAIIAEEKHKDGTPHLHILLSFKNKFITRDRHVFDFIAMKHGSYETVRSLKDAINYVMKEGNYLKIGNIPLENGSQKVSKSTVVAEMLRSGKTLEEIWEAEPGFCLLNMKKIKELSFWIASLNQSKSLPGLKYPISYEGEDEATLQIVDWLNTSLSSPLPFKAKQLYIFGPSNYCKTSLLQKISSFIPVYDMPMEEHYYDFFVNDRFQLCLLDEFKGHKTIQFLNLWLQGSKLTLKVKLGQYLKTQNIPTIILSNYSLEESYSKADLAKLYTLQNRLTIIELKNPIDIDNIKFEAANGKQPDIPYDLSQPQIEIEPSPPTEDQFTTMRPDDNFIPCSIQTSDNLYNLLVKN